MNHINVVLQHDITGQLPFILNRHGKPIPCNETEERIACLASGLARVRSAEFLAPDAGDDEVARLLSTIHDTQYLAFLEQWSQAHASNDTFLFEHPYHPEGIAPDTPIIGGIYHTAFESARTAISAAHIAARGGIAYGLCRPPGHHAGRAFLGGHCYLNNAALAVAALMEHGHQRVGLIDFDIHFGNGSSAILAEMPNAFFGSVHGATDISYPYLETWPPNDRQVFIPFSEPPTPDEFVSAVMEMVRRAMAFGCTALVVSAGYDVVANDPHGIWTLSPSVLQPLGAVFAHSELPLCIVQEGGYNPELLGECAFEFASGLVDRAGSRTPNARATSAAVAEPAEPGAFRTMAKVAR